MVAVRTWVTMGLTGFAGLIGGIQMGYSAIGEINPVYMRGAEPRLSYADLSGYRSPSWAPAQTEASAMYAEPSQAPEFPEDGIVHRAAAIDYSDYRPIEGPAPVMDGRAASAPEPAIYRSGQRALEDAQPRPSTSDIERYAAMPIVAEPAEADLPPAEEPTPL